MTPYRKRRPDPQIFFGIMFAVLILWVLLILYLNYPFLGSHR